MWPQIIETVLNSNIIEMDIKKYSVTWLQILHVKKEKIKDWHW